MMESVAEALMEALDRDIDAARNALASSFWDCHGQMLDSELPSGMSGMGGVDWHVAVGVPSDLEVPVDMSFSTSPIKDVMKNLLTHPFQDPV